MADPFADDVVTLLRMNSTAGSTTFADETGKFAFTAAGNAQIGTTTVKYGTGALALDGSGDWIATASNQNYNFGTDNFTVEAWVYLNAAVNNYQAVFANAYTTWRSGGRSLAFYGSAVPTTSQRNRFAVSCYDASGPLCVSTNTFTTGQWYHVALTRVGGTLRLFVNGNLEGTSSTSLAMDFSLNGTRIGANGWDGLSSNWNGYIDELRVTKGVGRYTASFTAPTAEFEYAIVPGTKASSMELGGWVEPMDGLAGSALEIGAWLDPRAVLTRRPIVNLLT